MSAERRKLVHAVGGGGFTLIEILLAMTLLAIVAAVVGAAFNTSLKSTERAEAHIERHDRIRTAIQVLDSQIRSAVPVAADETGIRTTRFRGTGQEMHFATTYSLWQGPWAFVNVSYTVAPDDSGGYSLRIAERVSGADQGRETGLVTGCGEIRFEYLGREDAGGDWRTAWEDPASVPGEVRIVLSCGGPAFGIMSPLAEGTKQ